MRDSFVFYRSFSDAAKKMNTAEKAQFLDVLCDYTLDDKDDFTDLFPMVDISFGLIKPLIDKNNIRFENGKRGGRPKPNNNQTITKIKPNNNQTITKIKPNNNQTITKIKPNNNQTITKIKPNNNQQRTLCICICICR